MKIADIFSRGRKQEPPTADDLDHSEEVDAAQKQSPYLKKISEGAAAEFVKNRWERLESRWKKIQTELKVNYLRYNGEQFVQTHPTEPNRVWSPAGARKSRPPVINKIKRTVHRYQAQVTADEPVVEAVPVDHTDDARDAAEAATHVLRGEWDRMNLNRVLQSTVQSFSVFRSAFWFFEWEKDQKRVPARKFFEDDEGNKFLAPVDSKGNQVEEAVDAAKIWQGNTKVELMTPMNVRWDNAEYAHEADEVLVSKIITLGQLYEMAPQARDVQLKELIGSVPVSARKWLHDIRGLTSQRFDGGADLDEVGSRRGHGIREGSSLLDEPVMLRHYFRKRSRQYPDGLHMLVAGDFLVFRRKLRQGIIPIAHFKCLYEVEDNLGLSVVDLLKDPQELLDFVNGQILRYLQSLKRRWFVPMQSGVKDRDLLNPTRSVIRYNPAAGEPKPETQTEIPRSLTEWVDRFDNEFDDQSGIHDIMQGKHVPGVSSGRHAEALRAGDETILGLTRTQMKEGLERSGRVLLHFVKNEWETERRVRYFGDQREYVDKAFRNSDVGDTSEVRLKQSTLLMLTPAQKLETIFGYFELGAIDQEDVRRLAPIGDTAGLELSEDVHVKRARRQNERFLDGPPPVLEDLHEEVTLAMDDAQSQMDTIESMLNLGAIEQEDAQIALTRIQSGIEEIQQEWQAELNRHAPSHRQWEDDIEVAGLHATEHFRALATDTARRKPEWWIEPFESHARLEWELANPDQVAAQAQARAAQQQAAAGGGAGGQIPVPEDGGTGSPPANAGPPSAPPGVNSRGFASAGPQPGEEGSNAVSN